MQLILMLPACLWSGTHRETVHHHLTRQDRLPLHRRQACLGSLLEGRLGSDQLLSSFENTYVHTHPLED